MICYFKYILKVANLILHNNVLKTKQSNILNFSKEIFQQYIYLFTFFGREINLKKLAQSLPI